jgi:hypothetical protein
VNERLKSARGTARRIYDKHHVMVGAVAILLVLFRVHIAVLYIILAPALFFDSEAVDRCVEAWDKAVLHAAAYLFVAAVIGIAVYLAWLFVQMMIKRFRREEPATPLPDTEVV